jgi:hypothetical protein
VTTDRALGVEFFYPVFSVPSSANGAHDGQIAPSIVVPVEKAQLLFSVRGIIGRIEIDRDAIGPASEAFGVVADNNVGQFDCEFVKILFRWSIALLAIVVDASR